MTSIRANAWPTELALVAGEFDVTGESDAAEELAPQTPSSGAFCCQVKVWSVRCGRLSEFDSTSDHWLRSIFFSSRKYVSARATASSLLSEAPGASSASVCRTACSDPSGFSTTAYSSGCESRK